MFSVALNYCALDLNSRTLQDGEAETRTLLDLPHRGGVRLHVRRRQGDGQGQRSHQRQQPVGEQGTLTTWGSLKP